jgi:pyridoxal phosphate enzyme (YggS family)
MMGKITDRVREHLIQIPCNVLLVAAVKSRTAEEVNEALAAGIKAIGENYVQEAEEIFPGLKHQAEKHFIGHLQKNKVKKAIPLFDVIETVDSVELAAEIDKRCKEIGKVMRVFIEVNSGRESQKAGIFPEKAGTLVTELQGFRNIELTGFMTMGPWVEDPEELRPYFRETYNLFQQYRNEKIRHLSMGMSDSWRIAVEEGATIVRIGTALFGPRPKRKD